MYDLKLIPIHHQQGIPIPQLPGFLGASPPRRAARSRAEDLLILSFTTNGGERVTPEIQDDWLGRLVQIFFKTSGSVTSALRALIETLNMTLLEQNLKNATEGAAVVGAINLAAVHGQSIYIAQSGLTHAYTLSEGDVNHFYDASQTDRGLGLSRTPAIRYYQADLGKEGYCFMTDKPPKTWMEDQLNFGGFPNLEQVRRRLLNQASPNLRLDLVQIIPGEGRIISTPTPTREKADRAKPSPVDVEQAPVKIEAYDLSNEIADISDTQQLSQESPPIDTDEREETDIFKPSSVPLERDPQDVPEPSENELELRFGKGDPDLVTQEPIADGLAEPIAKADSQPRKSFNEQFMTLREGSLKGLARFFDWWRKAQADVGLFFKKFLSRIGITEGEEALPLSNRTLLLIAVIVPMLVVAMAVGVYLSRGKTLQYQYYMEQAELASISASAAEDPFQAREGWAQTILFLDQAESFRRTDEIAQLRTGAQRALDTLDGAIRLAYHPAIVGALYDEINITRIISYGLDLYLLDAAGGRVIHATRSSQGYQVDADFSCSVGNFSGGGIDSLVDMVPQPINNPYQAHILAADAHGNIIYCGPGQDPLVQTLPQGEVMVGAVTRIASEGNLLYVLDPSVESVRVYRSINGQFLDPPSDFFGGASDGQKPQLSSMVDLAVNGADLYLLRDDGRLVNCVASGLPSNPVNCENPVTYMDGRPGYDDQALAMPDSRFVSLLYTEPPEPAVNILDAENADIFRFSLRFRLHQRLRSDFGDYEIVSPSATAFTIGVDRIAFIAFGYQVFYAYVE
jgi:hypothetical protein